MKTCYKHDFGNGPARFVSLFGQGDSRSKSPSILGAYKEESVVIPFPRRCNRTQKGIRKTDSSGQLMIIVWIDCLVTLSCVIRACNILVQSNPSRRTARGAC